MAAPDSSTTAHRRPPLPAPPRVLGAPTTSSTTITDQLTFQYPIQFADKSRTPVKLNLASKPITSATLSGRSGAGSTNGIPPSGILDSSRDAVNGSGTGFGFIPVSVTAKRRATRVSNPLDDTHDPPLSRKGDLDAKIVQNLSNGESIASCNNARTREAASDAYPTPNTPPSSSGDPVVDGRAGDTPVSLYLDHQPSGPTSKFKSSANPTRPAVSTRPNSPSTFESASMLDVPPSPPPTDPQPSPPPMMFESEVGEPQVDSNTEPTLPRGPTPPPPFDPISITAWRTIYDPHIEGLASKDKGKGVERRYNGQVPDNHPPLVVVDPRLTMSIESKQGLKGRRPFRPKVYLMKPYEVSSESLPCPVFSAVFAD
jgi:hypothetical protein